VACVPIRVGHSADPDDAFMVWALEAGRVDQRGLDLQPVVSDIQSLNEWAREGRLEVTAFSAGAYPEVADKYAVFTFGASFGEGYGPIVVAREYLPPEDLRKTTIAIPGRMTTAYLVLGMALGGEPEVATDFPFDEILDEVVSGRSAAGLIIHEGQLTYGDAGLVKVLDLGEWWRDETSLPLPLGLIGVRRDIENPRVIAQVLHAAIDIALDNRAEAMEYARGFGRGIDADTADEFVAMYVNDLTRDMGSRGEAAVAELMRRAGAVVDTDFVRP
jgi:1,4-dihydroxy-6-naphthoate synthase